MSIYRIRFRKRAKEELKRGKSYSTQFSDELDAWLEDIARSASEKRTSDSIDLEQLLEEGINLADNPSTWNHLWKRWWGSTLIDKAKALLVVLGKRSAPWQIRATSRWFHGILGAFDCEVQVCFEIDHVKRQVIFTKFIGLPGED